MGPVGCHCEVNGFSSGFFFFFFFFHFFFFLFFLFLFFFSSLFFFSLFFSGFLCYAAYAAYAGYASFCTLQDRAEFVSVFLPVAIERTNASAPPPFDPIRDITTSSVLFQRQGVFSSTVNCVVHAYAEELLPNLHKKKDRETAETRHQDILLCAVRCAGYCAYPGEKKKKKDSHRLEDGSRTLGLAILHVLGPGGLVCFCHGVQVRAVRAAYIAELCMIGSRGFFLLRSDREE